MIAINKQICVIGNTIVTTNSISEELKYYLQEYVDIIAYSFERTNNPDISNSNIYIATSQKVIDKAEKLIPKDRLVIVADRTLNLRKIHDLLNLESGTKAILVQSSIEMSLMSIDIIKNLGINHIELIPYAPDAHRDFDDGITTAITTGMLSYIPPRINNIIDLGINTLNLSVYSELVQALNLPISLLNDISNYYIETILSITLSQLTTSRENYELKHRLEIIINAVNDGIVSIDEKGNVVLVNTLATNIFKISGEDSLGKHVNNIFPSLNINDPLNMDGDVENEVIKLDDKYYIINKNLIVDRDDNYLGVVATINESEKIQKQNVKLRQSLRVKGHVAKHNFDIILGNSPAITSAKELAKNFAKTDLNILLIGESGTGKELFAQSIHNHSNRRNKPFVAINIAAFPDNLAQSELFGYEEGSFTGAKRGGKIGLFEQAHTGTVFLDEIGDSSLELQRQILRVLEEKEVRRIGGSSLIPVDVRIICATHQNLPELIEKKLFRSDLFFRLATLPIKIPSLRQREDDMFFLLNHFSRSYYNRKLSLDPNLLEFFLNYDWPGNIRELENLVNFLCTTTPLGALATLENLPYYILNNNFGSKTKTAEKNKNNSVNQNYLAMQVLQELKLVTLDGKSIGRKKLLDILLNKGVITTESKLRTILNKLSEEGYIAIGQTRQGSVITEKGLNILI